MPDIVRDERIDATPDKVSQHAPLVSHVMRALRRPTKKRR
jgi:hypothetical protein